ncbi:hypothetical protein HII12_002364 [Brettanomyces bruxellensis]|uniref:DUF3020 domain-containing protein n=1 Tax=Dekkera bruxellensis TaxID=5007 RepID=A0A8H6BJG0_DEKBR|nr:hypothetical protein HII12_002364 [Brettanomyces bruxellensis]
MSEQQEFPPGAFDKEMASAVKDAVKAAADEMLDKTDSENDTNEDKRESTDNDNVPSTDSRVVNADSSTDNFSESKHDEDGRDFALNQAIEDAIRVNFGGTKEDEDEESADEDNSSDDDKVELKKDEEPDETSALEAAEMDLNREIKDAFQESGVVEAQSESASGSESEVSTDYSAEEVPKDDAIGTQEMQDAIYDALKDVEGNVKEKNDHTTEVDDSMAQLELNKAIEEALNVPIAEQHAEYKEESNSSNDHEQTGGNTANIDLNAAVSDALKNTEMDSESKDDDLIGTSSTSSAEERALKQALEQVAQNVVNTALEPEKKNESADNVKEPSKKNNEEPEDQHWDDIMLKAMEMATENPEALLSSLNANSNLQGVAAASKPLSEINKVGSTAASRIQKLPDLNFPFSATANERRSVSALAQSMVNAAISAAAMRAAAQQRLMELTGQRNVENLSGKDFLSAYQKYISSRKANSKASPFTRSASSSTAPISSRFNLPSVFNKTEVTQVKGQKKKKSMSIAEVLALERQRMGLVAPSTEDIRASSSSSDMNKDETTSKSIERQSLLGFIISNVSMKAIDPDVVSSKLSSEMINNIKHHVNSAASKIMAEELLESEKKQDLDEMEKRKLENRERKKRWRVINIERNRDNDLRIRVTKKANSMYPAPEQEVEKQNWINAEFSRRKQKRLLREQAQQRELLGLKSSSVTTSHVQIIPSTSLKNKSISEILSNDEFLKRISAVCNSIGIKIDVDGLKQTAPDKVVAVTALGIGILVSYIAGTPTLSVSNLEVIINSVVNSLKDFIDSELQVENHSLKSSSIPPALKVFKARSAKRSLPTPFVPAQRQVHVSQPPQKKVAYSKQDSTFSSKKALIKHKKKYKSKSQKDQPVDFKKFMSPHPLPASFWSSIEENKRKDASPTNVHKKEDIKVSSQISERPTENEDQSHMTSSINKNTLPSNMGTDRTIGMNKESSHRSWDFITSVTSSSIKAVRLPKYMKPKLGKNKEEEPHMSSLRSVNNVAKGHQQSGSTPSVSRPSYYGIRKPAAFKKPTAFTKSDDLEHMRESPYKIVPLKPQ